MTRPYQVLHHPQRIPVQPTLDDLPLDNPMDRHHRHSGKFTSRGDTGKFASVSAADRKAGDDFVPFCHLLFDRDMQVDKSAAEIGDKGTVESTSIGLRPIDGIV